MTHSMKHRTINVRFDGEQNRLLREVASRTGVNNLSGYIRQAVMRQIARDVAELNRLSDERLQLPTD